MRQSVWVFLALGTVAVAPIAAQPQRPIQDNSFLLEEAYNQERGVVQHISTFTRMWNSRDFAYTFTEEWPGARGQKHQFSYTLVDTHAGAFAGSGAGWGDIALHYRRQLVGDGEGRVAFAPRLSVLLPTGDVAKGRGSGGFGAQSNLPVSVVLGRRVVSHWNAGMTVVPRARGLDGGRASTLGYNVGGSLVFLVHPGFNVLVEAVRTGYQSVAGGGRTEWLRTAYFSPGIRWAHNFASGLQIVPGVAAPLGIGASGGERGLILYLSVEHSLHRGR